MNYRTYETQLAKSYDSSAGQYRVDDEVEARSENHRRLGGNLRRICRSFSRPIRVLEIGCGTGRYFHWLDNVELLVGTDISAEMLKFAAHPVLEKTITAREIRLVRGSIYDMAFQPASFDFIYCLGVFGYGAAVTPALAEKMNAWLTPGGWLYFDAIEVPHCANLRDRVKEALYPRLPRRLQDMIDGRGSAVPLIRHGRDEVQRIMQGAGFADFVLASNACKSPLWNGTHVECSACKSDPSAQRAVRMQFEFAAAEKFQTA